MIPTVPRTLAEVVTAEEHEMNSAAGLTALIIEGERLDRFRERGVSVDA